MCATTVLYADVKEDIPSPDGRTVVSVIEREGQVYYQVERDGKRFVHSSRLGLRTNAFDFSLLEFVSSDSERIQGTYTMDRGKASEMSYDVTKAVLTFKNTKDKKIQIEFRVGNNDVAFRYFITKEGETGSVRILEEMTEFTFPDTPEHDYVKTYLTPQSHALIGWKRTKPSYEEYYGIGKPVIEPNGYGHGYTFPALFQLGGDGWVLVSETGVDGRFCGSRLGEYYATAGQTGASYKIEFPMPDENNGNGTSEPGIAIPGGTPWRTITLGETLAPIVETTVAWDHIEPLYETGHDYRFGKSAWSWIVWQDASMNMPDQKAYVDFASEMGLPYLLVDALWDENLGYEGIEELAAYAKSKNVGIFVWLPWLTVEHHMDLFETFENWGIVGVKIDFMDRQDQWMIDYYDRVAKEGAEHHIMIDFHGAFHPSGLEYRYPNVLTFEGVRGMEFNGNCIPDNSIWFPFIRGAVGPMDYTPGPMICYQPEVHHGNRPFCAGVGTKVYNMAAFVLFESHLQMLMDNPCRYDEWPDCRDYLTSVPVNWDETRVLAAEAGQYIVMAKRRGNKWFVAGITNDNNRDIDVSLDILPAGKDMQMTSFVDGVNADIMAMDYRVEKTAVNKDSKLRIKMARNGGFAAVIE